MEYKVVWLKFRQDEYGTYFYIDEELEIYLNKLSKEGEWEIFTITGSQIILQRERTVSPW